MRLRFLGQYLHMPLAALAAFEGLLFVAVLFLAAMRLCATVEGAKAGSQRRSAARASASGPSQRSAAVPHSRQPAASGCRW